MKNLVFLNRGVINPVSTLAPDLPIAASCFDVITNSLTVALGPGEFDGSIEVHQFEKTGAVKLFATFQVDPEDKVLSFSHFSDSYQLIFIMQKGDIITATYDPMNLDDLDSVLIEIVGSIEDGIHSAQWSPDEETLSLVTGSKNLVLLSRQFEPIIERLLTTDDANKSKHVSVGWGKRETQFKGKGARAVERQILESLRNSGLKEGEEIRDPTMPSMIDSGNIGKFDSKKVSISWRGDCQYFAVSMIENINNEEIRMIRFFDREGNLDSVSEPVNGLEDHLAWKPQGSLIASTQRKNPNADIKDGTVKDILINPKFVESREKLEDLDLIFFERNGLRHGEFSLRLPISTKVEDISWNNSSEILSILVNNSIQLWTMKNYHWYLKQTVYPNNKDSIIQSLNWHSEKPLTLMLITDASIEIIDFAYNIISGPTIPPTDISMVGVIDGDNCGISPLTKANVPPPMSYRDVKLDEEELFNDFAISKNNEKFVGITNNGNVYFMRYSYEKNIYPKIISSLTFNDLVDHDNYHIRQVCFANNSLIGILVDDFKISKSKIILIDVSDTNSPKIIKTLQPNTKIILIKSHSSYNSITFQTINGSVYNIHPINYSMGLINQLGQLCYDYTVIENNGSMIVFGLASNGKLYANKNHLCSAVTSFKLTNLLLLFTTAQHQLRFVHLNQDFNVYKVNDEELNISTKEAITNHNNNNEHTISFEDERIRAIEKGSILISVSPSNYSVVLQAPRGNLETIYPRIMVLSDIRKNIKLKNYKKAFLICRTHRIDLDILHDYDSELFSKNLEKFIDDIDNEDHLNLFIGTLKNENVCLTKYKETLSNDNSSINNNDDGKINKICQGLLNILQTSKYQNKYYKSIITAFASQTPANLHDALNLISNFKDFDDKEKSLEYLCFLQDVNLLYRTSLSLYDIPLTLLIAQQSQKDPKEYLPFLQNLHEQSVLRKKFLIDDHLKKFEKALNHLFELEKEDENIKEEFNNYMIQHGLYHQALKFHHYDLVRRNEILEYYADSLFTDYKYNESGLVFEMLSKYSRAIDAYILAQNWQNCLSIIDANFEEFKDELETSCDSLVESLTEARRYKEAAFIEFNYLKNIVGAVRLYCKDYRYDEAILLINNNKKPQLINEIVEPLIGEGFGTIAELISDCKGQINSQLRRLRELRDKKKNDPYSFFGLSEMGNGTNDIDAPDDVSVVASETSTKESFFTRYTGKTSGTAKTGASRRTSKNRRREERKKARGKKGTIYEEEYLISSIGRLIERLRDTEPEAKRLIEGMIRLNKFEQAYEIQKHFKEVLKLLKENVAEVYSMTEDDRTRINDQGELFLIEIIPTPLIKDFEGYEVLDY